MATILYNIDKTEKEYIRFEEKSLQELKAFLYPNRNFQDCCGIIIYINAKRKVELSIAAIKKYGVYVGISDEKSTYLSISNSSKLSNVIDVWGDGLYVSEGLFISPQLTWKCISELIEVGTKCKDIDWITPDELPEEGNYI